MKIIIFLKSHIFILIAIIIAFSVFMLGVLSLFNSGKEIQINNPETTQSGIPISPNTSINPTGTKVDREDIIAPTDIKSLRATEILPGGSIKYTSASPDPKRPNLVITTKEGIPLFKRIVPPVNSLPPLTEFTKVYGQPKWVFTGSVFYGQSARSYIYADYGFALIVNPQTNQVFEEHTFPKMKIEEYINKYGEDIPSQP